MLNNKVLINTIKIICYYIPVSYFDCLLSLYATSHHLMIPIVFQCNTLPLISSKLTFWLTNDCKSFSLTFVTLFLILFLIISKTNCLESHLF